MCGKYKNSHSKEVIKCEKCGVDVTTKKVRRERMGHIELASPVSHIWYFKAIPSRMALVLDISPKQLEQVLYFAENVVLDPGNTPLMVGTVLNEKQYVEYREMYGSEFRVGMGAEAVKELLARIAVQLRKAEKSETTTVMFAGQLTLDEQSHAVEYAGEPVKLTKTEYSILKLLMVNQNRTIAKSVILERIAEDTPDCTEDSLKQHISNLRVKIRKASDKDMIEAVWGIGYKLIAD